VVPEERTHPSLSFAKLGETLDLGRRGSDFSLDETLKPHMHSSHPRPASRPAGPRPSTPPRDSFDADGQTLRVREVIAEGGMGVVRVAEQSALRRDVAVKTLRDEFLDERFIDRMMREARITGLVEHPNIVPVYELRADDRGAPVMVMKRIEGVSWRGMIRDAEHPSFPPDAGDRLVWHLRVLMSVCDAVHYAHSRGIVHLDLKPDNVMIGAYREVYLVDWGVACSLREEHRGWLPMADEVGDVIGTPSYIAPEMVDVAHSRLGIHTDVYLLGSVLHEILTGRPPHRGGTLQETLYAAYEAEAPSFAPDVPGELAAICRRAMQPRSADRYRDVEAFRAALDEFLRHRSSSALAESLVPRLEELRSKLSEAQGFDAREEREIDRTFDECRFGFGRALEDWADNALARAGLQDALLLMAEHHADRGDIVSAEALLDDLPDHAEAAQRAEVLRARVASRRDQTERLIRQAKERDHAIGRRERGIFVLVLALVLMAPVAAFFGLERGFSLPWEPLYSYLFEAIAIVVMGVSNVVGGRRLAPNDVSRRMLWGYFALAVLVLAQRWIADIVGVPQEKTSLALDLMMFSAGAFLIGTLTDRRFLLAGVAFFGAAVATAFAPTYTFLWICLASLLGPGVVAAVWIYEGEKMARRGRSTY